MQSNSLNKEIEIFPKVIPACYFDSFGDRVYVGHIVVNGMHEDGTLDVEVANISPEFQHLLSNGNDFPILADVRAGVLTQVQIVLPSRPELNDDANVVENGDV